MSLHEEANAGPEHYGGLVLAGGIMTSVKDIPSYHETLDYLSSFLRTKYKLSKRRFDPQIYGGNVGAVEVAMDLQKITMLAPSSIVSTVSFESFSSKQLDTLDEGKASDGRPVIVESKTIVKRLYVDVFVDCMQSVHGLSWKNIKAYTRKTPFPMILATPLFMFFVAPIIGQGVTITGRYNPQSVFAESRVTPVIVVCRYCGVKNKPDQTKCPSCGAPLPQ